ncbi:hypothetical protein FYK55_13455 [Roseiconus nitratireducens]|uniref:Uncharacterized protein n=1 Tax=Roseiconus nitratireducens TaxID=2605748 RepID=A0A5M6DBL8_9BACT|nr:hypothetical protein [Roseiconus nitratireducens]KAA5542545.1 hypothetical protein FYK55_13455 [Roseiconus nitratireducens]
MAAPAASSEGFDLAPGETLVPGSVQTMAAPAAAGAAAGAAAASGDDSGEEASEPVESASDAAPEGDAPPAPKPDADTNI